MLVVKLLAAPEMLRTKIGDIMHNSGKTMVRMQIDAIHNHYRPVLEYKRKNGWIKDHVAALEESWKRLEAMYDVPINDNTASLGWQRNPDDRNRIMFQKVFDLLLCLLDEDTAYDMPFLILLRDINENWARYEISAERAYQLHNFGNLYKSLLESIKPLPDITHQEDPEEPDYEDLEDEANVGV